MNTEPLVDAAELYPSNEQLRGRKRSREATNVRAVALRKVNET